MLDKSQIMLYITSQMKFKLPVYTNFYLNAKTVSFGPDSVTFHANSNRFSLKNAHKNNHKIF
jgi:hypothetical protein